MPNHTQTQTHTNTTGANERAETITTPIPNTHKRAAHTHTHLHYDIQATAAGVASRNGHISRRHCLPAKIVNDLIGRQSQIVIVIDQILLRIRQYCHKRQRVQLLPIIEPANARQPLRVEFTVA